MYDVEQLEHFKEMESVDLIVKLLVYSKTLEDMVIDLRIKVNRLTPTKNEMFYNRSSDGISMDEFIDHLDQYLHWYNHCRIKKSLGGMSPLHYRQSLGTLLDWSNFLSAPPVRNFHLQKTHPKLKCAKMELM